MRLTRIFILLIILIGTSITSEGAERKSCIDKGWRFSLGEHYESIANDYDDSSWRALDLPHDWSVEPDAAALEGDNIGIFSKKSPGYRDTGWTIGGIGWYRKSFTLNDEDMGKCISLLFEGVYNYADVWINGIRLYHNHYGYTPFKFDITKYCNEAGKTNTIVVRVENSGHNSRWYSGSGIYRHVWMIKTPKMHLEEWDTYIQDNTLVRTKAKIDIETKVYNENGNEESATVKAVIYDKEGHEVASGTSAVNVGAYSNVTTSINLKYNNPSLWSAEDPYLYKAVLTLTSGNGDTDETSAKFGIRRIRVNSSNGLTVNGKSVLLRGGCVHHDTGLLGSAAYNRAEDRKLQLLKDQGFNAIRCSHNMPSQHFLDVCDSLGFYVIDEAFDQWLVAKNPNDYHQYFAEFSDRDMQTMVRRDRNHASVIMWSLGNEIPGRITSDGIAAAKRLRNTILNLDESRPITNAVNTWDSYGHSWDEDLNNAFISVDVAGYNYLYFYYEGDHKKNSSLVMMGTETYPKNIGTGWNYVENLNYVIGDFVWTAMDYLGEAGCGNAGPSSEGYGYNGYGWPWFNSWCGDIDLIGEKKPQSYYRDVVWRQKAITMGVEKPVPSGTTINISQWGWQLEEQCWTYDGYGENDKFTVNVYSRSPKVRLYLNDELIGEKETSSTYLASFSVGYKPGTLRAVTFDGSNEGEAFELFTTGQPVALRLRADRSEIKSDGTDLSYITIELVDSEGRVVYDSNRKVNISIDGNGTLMACGNASPNDMESFRSKTPRLYNGRALAIAKSTDTEGEMHITVASDGLKTETITIKTSEIPTGIKEVTMPHERMNERLTVANHLIKIDGKTPDHIYGINGTAFTCTSPLREGAYIALRGGKAYKVMVK